MGLPKYKRTLLRYSPLLKFLTVAALFFLGNRMFNHVSAWGGIGLIGLGGILAVYFTIKPINSNEHNEEN